MIYNNKNMTNTNLQIKSIFIAIFLILSFFVFSNISNAQSSNIEWIVEPNEKGFAQIEYNGETLNDLLNDLEEEDCRVRIVWIASTGYGYLNIEEAPSFINNNFLNKYGNNMPSNTTITLHCYANTPNIENTETTDNSLSIEWNNDNKTKEYKIEYCLENNCKTLTTKDNNITIEDLEEDTEYSIRIKAIGKYLNDSEYSKKELIATDSTIQDLNLEETYIQWITNPEIDTDRNKQGDATIQYGGGSFYQLISRLSIEGCEVINLNIDNLHYDFRNPNEENQDFKDTYTDRIEQNTNINIMCIDNCGIIYGLNLLSDEWKGGFDSLPRCEPFRYILESVISRTDCTTDWTSDIQKVFLQIPVLQDLCKIEVVSKTSGEWGLFFPSIYFAAENIILQAQETTIVFQSNKKKIDLNSDDWLYTTIHEVCHAHQVWYTFKQQIDNDYLKNNNNEEARIEGIWYETDMAQEFIDITDFEQQSNGEWKLKGNIKGVDSYVSSDPIELSADVCALYMIKRIRPNSDFKRFTKSPYLTPELEEWVEKYIVLPA